MAHDSSVTWTTLTLDCADAEAMADFYSAVLGWAVTARDGDGWVQLRDPAGGVGLNIQAEPGYIPPVWPEADGEPPKMMHLELLVVDLEEAVERVVQAGGTPAAHQPPDRDPSRLRVMLDPAGHPFCLYVAGE